MGQQFRLHQFLHRGHAHGHRQGVAAVGRAVAAGRHAAGGLGRGQAGADREAAAQGLGHRHDVRIAGAVGPLVGKQLARPAQAALDLIVDQQDAVFVAQLAQAAQAADRQRPRPALALHRLDDDRRGRGADGGLQRLVIAVGQVDEARHRRAEALQIAGVAGGVHRRQRPAVERAVETDDVDPLGLALGPVILARGLDRALDRLGPRVREEADVGEGVVGQQLRQLLLVGDPEDVGRVPEFLGLILHRLHQLGVIVPQRGHRDAGHAVEIGLAFGGIESRALASLERQRGACVDAHDVIAGNGGGGRLGHGVSPPEKEASPTRWRRGPEGLAFSSRRAAKSMFCEGGRAVRGSCDVGHAPVAGLRKVHPLGESGSRTAQLGFT